MARMLISLLVLACAVAGLALTVRAQQDAAPQHTAISSDNQSSDNQSSEKPKSLDEEPEPSPVSACTPDTILVKMNPGADPAAVIARHGGTIVRTIGGIDVQVVSVPGGTGQQAIDALSTDPDVKYAEADQIVHATGAGGGCP
jgi:hypothetical protein